MYKLNGLTYWLDGEPQTRLAGRLLARDLLPVARTQPVVVFVRGDLGAGKSTFVRGFLTEAGVLGVMPSPTYSLVEPYQVDGLTLYHMDAYRLADSQELDYLGLDDLHQPGCLTLVEWPDHIRDALPDPFVTVDLRISSFPMPADGAGPQAGAGVSRKDPGDPATSSLEATIGRAVTFALGEHVRATLEDRNGVADWSELRQVLT